MIDTHFRFDRCPTSLLEVCRTAERHRTVAGFRNPAWPSLACYPEIHARRQVPLEFDVAFIGDFVLRSRLEILWVPQQFIPEDVIQPRLKPQVGSTLYVQYESVFSTTASFTYS